MNILIDENIPKKSAELLLSYGYKVIDIRGTDLEGINDNDIFNHAKKNNAVFLTTNKDFYHTIHFTQKPHCGIIVIALSHPNTRNILEKLEWALIKFSKKDLSNKCILLSDTKCKVYN